MTRILFVCNFSSVHARTYIQYFAKRPEFEICVVSSFGAEEMEGVQLIQLAQSNMSTKSRISTWARTVGSWHPFFYRKLTVYNRKRVTQKRLEKLGTLELPFTPDIIHAHRTQPEGILGVDLAEKYPDAKFFLTTWGQDFIFWARYGAWLNEQTKRIVRRLDFALPDNARDARILKEDYLFKNQCQVMTATGGLDIKFLNGCLENQNDLELSEQFSFLSVRGYENSTIQIRSLLNSFSRFREKTGEGHFYIDTHFPGDPDRNRLLQSWIAGLNLEKHVTILHLKREEMFQYMERCDCYVSDTNADGLPLSLLESLFFGQVPIVFDHESTSQLKPQFDDFHCFSNHSVDSILNSWISVYQDGKRTEQKRAQSRRRVEKFYDRDSNLDNIASIYLDAVTKKTVHSSS